MVKISNLKSYVRQYCPGATNAGLLNAYAVAGTDEKLLAFIAKGGLSDGQIAETLLSDSVSRFCGDLLEKAAGGSADRVNVLSAIAMGKQRMDGLKKTLRHSDVFSSLKQMTEEGLVEEITRWEENESEEERDVKYEIACPLLAVWLRWVFLERKLWSWTPEHSRHMIEQMLPSYSGQRLEAYFRRMMEESGKYITVGTWWKHGAGRQIEDCEIDIVARPVSTPHLLHIYEVKRNKAVYNRGKLKVKARRMVGECCPRELYNLACLSVDDI